MANPFNSRVFKLATAPARFALKQTRTNIRTLLELQEDGIAVVLQTRVRGKLALRTAITNHRSRPEDFELLAREVACRGRRLIAVRP